MALVQLSDVVVPRRFTSYVQQQTEVKSRLIQSGAVARVGLLDDFLAGGGSIFNVPSFQDLPDDADNVSSDDAPGSNDSTPFKTATSEEIAVRLSRNGSWSSADLAASLAGADPMESIASRVSDWWARRIQDSFIATVKGVLADNTANDSGDYTFDASNSGSFGAGVTEFSAKNFLSATLTLGDSMEDVSMVMMHSVVYNKAQNANLIDFIPDARGEVNIPTFLGRQVIVDDRMPNAANVYDTWLFGFGAIGLGMGLPKVPTEVFRNPEAGNGGGVETLYSRQDFLLHPAGHAYSGTYPKGGPTNAATSNNLAAATSWDRVYPERKQIKFARLLTTEA